MTKGLSLLSTTILTIAVAASACGGKTATAPMPEQGGAPAAGGEPAIMVSDQAEWDALLAQGKTTFDAACGACHPNGEADLGPALKGHRETTAHMTMQIREGSGRMKPIGPDKLPEDQMKGLLVYLASIQAVGDVKGP